MSAANGKCWCFTWHASATPAEWKEGTLDGVFKKMFECLSGADDLDYFFAGEEKCPSTGSPHLQGYARFEKKKRLPALKKIDDGIHWEIARGDWEQNYEYCTKVDKDPWVFGELPTFAHNGDREKNRWERAYTAAIAGEFDDIPKDILLRTYNGIKAVYRDHQKAPPSLLEYNNEWIFGASGSGKSTKARAENVGAYPKEANKWWCGYQGEDCVLIEDIDPDVAKYLARYIKVWCDKFPFVGEVKAGSSLIRPKKIVFTSQYTIEECFNPRDAAAIRRRCKVRKFENFVEVPDDFVDPPGGTVGSFSVPETPIALVRQVAQPVPDFDVEAQKPMTEEDIIETQLAAEEAHAEDDKWEEMEQAAKRMRRDIRKGYATIDLTQADD